MTKTFNLLEKITATRSTEFTGHPINLQVSVKQPHT